MKYSKADIDDFISLSRYKPYSEIAEKLMKTNHHFLKSQVLVGELMSRKDGCCNVDRK